jgi:Zn-finger nucleic acid-binding protein
MRSPVSNEPMLVLELAGVEIDYCPLTQGIWLDAGELEALFENTDEADQLLASFKQDADSREKKVRCPICRKKMDKVYVAGDVIIDRCPNQHGLWFDEGELLQVLKAGHEGGEGKVIVLLREMFSDIIKENSNPQ